MADPEQVHTDLNTLAQFVHVEAWGALGGEPTLHPRLREILSIVRESRIADRVELWTNGIAFKKTVPGILDKSVMDALVLSRYEGKLSDDLVRWIAEWCESEGIDLVMKDERRHPNFKTLFELVPTNAADTKRKYAGCFFRHFSRVANEGFFYTCCCAPQMPVLVQHRPHGSDGIKIEGLTEAALRAYLDNPEPLGACTICAGRDTAVDVQWSEEKQPIAWLRKSGMIYVTAENVANVPNDNVQEPRI